MTPPLHSRASSSALSPALAITILLPTGIQVPFGLFATGSHGRGGLVAAPTHDWQSRLHGARGLRPRHSGWLAPAGKLGAASSLLVDTNAVTLPRGALQLAQPQPSASRRLACRCRATRPVAGRCYSGKSILHSRVTGSNNAQLAATVTEATVTASGAPANTGTMVLILPQCSLSDTAKSQNSLDERDLLRWGLVLA